jgi:Zn-dependent protease
MGLEYILIALGIILASMTLHEAMHGFMAYYLGDDTAKLQGRLTLNPLKHIDPFLTIILPLLLAIAGGPIFGGAKPVPFNPARVRYDEWGAALVALAGPLTNFFIAFLGFGIASLLGIDVMRLGYFSMPELILALLVQINLGFFVFNMIPIPPLDGSRVLYALAPDFIKSGMEAVERYGVMAVFVIVIFANSLIIAYMVQAIEFFLSIFSFIFGAGA